jgi:hypothetical protein
MEDRHWTPERIIQNTTRLLNEIKKQEYKKLLQKGKSNEVVPRITADDTEFMEYHTRYPALFLMIVEKGDTFDIKQLLHMLTLRNKVDANEVSKHNADLQIGTEMVDKYVKPMIDRDNQSNKDN